MIKIIFIGVIFYTYHNQKNMTTKLNFRKTNFKNLQGTTCVSGEIFTNLNISSTAGESSIVSCSEKYFAVPVKNKNKK
jgi:hypothetical protein